MRLEGIDRLIGSVLESEDEAAAKAGNVFIQSTVVAGVAVPISTTTAPIVALWNPSDSNKLAVLLRFIASYVSGTTVGGSLGLSYTVGVGSAVATAAVFSAFNKVAPINGLIGRGAASLMNSSSAATNTLNAAGTWFYTMFQEYAAVAASAITPAALDHEFKGGVIVPPGVEVHVVGSAASGALLAQTLIWKEIDA